MNRIQSMIVGKDNKLSQSENEIHSGRQVYSILTHFSFDLEELCRGLAMGRAGAPLVTFWTSYLTEAKAQTRAINIVGYTKTVFAGSVFTGFPRNPSLTRPQIMRSVPNMLILPGFRTPIIAPATEK